jgi:hypothetical protein
MHSQNKTKQLVPETPYVTAPVYAVAQLAGRRSPIIISEVSPRSLRIPTAVRGTESSLNEPTTDLTFCKLGDSSLDPVGVPRSRDYGNLL